MIFSEVVYDILDEDEMVLLMFTLNQGLSSDYKDPRYCQIMPVVSSIQSLTGLNEDGIKVKDSLIEKIQKQYL